MGKDDQEVIHPESIEIQLKPIKDGKVDDSVVDDPTGMQLKVYRKRWLMLAVVALLNNLNTMSWIAFAPVANYVNFFYGEGSASWFSMIYMMMTIPVGVFAMWAGGFFGTRASILIAAATNGVGSLIRLLSAFLPMEYRFPVGMVGQGLAAVAYPFIMYLPSKVSNSWFPHNQRTLATMIGAMSNPLGVLLANTISPQLVKSPDDVPLLNILTCVPSVIVMVIAFVFVRRSEPKVAPSFSASSQEEVSFLSGLKQCVTSKQYLLLFLVMGGGIGMFNCLYTVMQELLCPTGYGNKFVGACAALMIIGGVIGAAASSIIVDRTKLYEETMKVAMGLAVVFGLIFMQLTLRTDLSVPIALSCFLFGVLGLATYPVGLELSVECTFPVSAATATGLIVLSGQIQSVIYVMVIKQLARPLQPARMPYQVCSIGKDDHLNHPKDNTQSVMAFSAIAALLVLILVVLFKPEYKRMAAEKQNRARVDKANEEDKATKRDYHGLPDQEKVTQPLRQDS